jgi:N-acetylglucosamine-6-phosphate deacetylase
MGIADRGEIAVGQVADMVLVDDDFVPLKTIVGGVVKFEKE